jgi:hypothetical protein
MCLEKLQENYVTTIEAARMIGKTADMIAKLCQSGRLPGAEKIGNTWLISRASASLMLQASVARTLKRSACHLNRMASEPPAWKGSGRKASRWGSL